MSAPGDRLLTVEDVAEVLACTPAHVRKLIGARELPATNLGLGGQPLYRVRRVDLDALVASRTTTPPPVHVPDKLTRLRRSRAL